MNATPLVPNFDGPHVRTAHGAGPRQVHLQLAALVVEWLSCDANQASRPGRYDRTAGTLRAIELGLAGIFRLGLGPLQPGFPCDRLRHAERSEIADWLFACGQAAAICHSLNESGVTPLVFKGLAVAERFWPQPWMRPPGDLDILVEEKALCATLSALARLGYRPREGDAPGRWRPPLSGVEAARPAQAMSVDVHVRLFRAIGSGLRTRDVLARAVPACFEGASVLRLDPVDEALHLALHAANHGAIHLKWFADLHAAAWMLPPEVWECAAERAIACHAPRAGGAVWRLLAVRIPGMPGALPPAMRPPAAVRALLKRLVRFDLSARYAGGGVLHDYTLGWTLEDRRHARFSRAVGLVERRVRSLINRLSPASASESPAAVRNQRWLEKALENGNSGPLWVTLHGSSMSPALCNGDRLLVASVCKGDNVAPGDIVIVRNVLRTTGLLAAHRVIGVDRGTVLTRGDACAFNDPPAPCRDVLAKVIAVDRRYASHGSSGGTS